MLEGRKEIDLSVCPFCGQELVHGKIYGESERAAYWLPIQYDVSDMGGWLLSIKKVERLGGIVLGEATKVAFFQKAPPDSYSCKACKLLITRT